MVDLSSFFVSGINDNAKPVSKNKWNDLLVALQTAINSSGGGGPGDVTAPTITSGDTFSTAENTLLTRTATANETVTWSKSGTDANSITLNPTTGVWSLTGDFETDSSITFNLIATDGAGLTATQPITVTIGDVNEDVVPPANEALSAPTLTLVTGNLVYPPQFDIGLDDTYQVGDAVRLEWRSKAGALIGSATNTIDLGEATAAAAVFTGLSSIATGTHRFRAFGVRSGEPDSAGSNIVIQGPDDIAPVLSAADAVMVNSTSGTAVVDTDTPEGTLYYLAVPAGETRTVAQIKAGSSVAVTSIGTKQVSITGQTPDTSVDVLFVHTDLAGNDSNIEAANFVTDAAALFTVQEVAQVTPFDNAYAGPSPTFTGLNFGPADSSRRLYLFNTHGAGALPAQVHIGGIAATKLAAADNASFISVWYADVPTGTSGDVVIGPENYPSVFAAKLVSVIGGPAGAPTVHSNLTYGYHETAAMVAPVTLVAGEVAYMYSYFANGALNPGFTNATELTTEQSAAGGTQVSARRDTAGSSTISVTGVPGSNYGHIVLGFKA